MTDDDLTSRDNKDTTPKGETSNQPVSTLGQQLAIAGMLKLVEQNIQT
jgi:hypothetical protein